MNLIIPMAGMGTRMRPHTLTIPKPLFSIAGKSIVERLIEEIHTSTNGLLDQIVLITGRFGAEVEDQLRNIAAQYCKKPAIVYQDEPLGTAHAIHCAKDYLSGPVVVAFADTLFTTSLQLNEQSDNLIWVQHVDDPSSFGVVVLNSQNHVESFVEKPSTAISNMAIIGIYYFKEASNLCKAIQHLIDHSICKGNEYQLTDALERMKSQNENFQVHVVDQWMDCGNVPATLETHKKILSSGRFSSQTCHINNSIVIEPVYFGEGVRVENSIIGPHVSIERGAVVSYSMVTNSIVKENALVDTVQLADSCIGADTTVTGSTDQLDISDFSKVCV